MNFHLKQYHITFNNFHNKKKTVRNKHNWIFNLSDFEVSQNICKQHNWNSARTWKIIRKMSIIQIEFFTCNTVLIRLVVME